MKWLLTLKRTCRICYVEFCKSILVLFFSLFCVVLGLECFLELSYSAFIVKKCPELDMKGVFGLSRELAEDERGKLLLSFSIAVVSICVACILSFATLKFFGMFFETNYLTFRIGVSLCGLSTLLFFALPYYHRALKASFALSQSKKYQKFET